MSTLPSTEKKTKQPASVYTVMLFLSMLFMLIAVIAMWVEYQRYAPQYWKVQEAKPSVMIMPADNSHLA
ncbi:MAG: hypothetical protein ACPHJ3_13950 [Rubripirellula sp.]